MTTNTTPPGDVLPHIEIDEHTSQRIAELTKRAAMLLRPIDNPHVPPEVRTALSVQQAWVVGAAIANCVERMRLEVLAEVREQLARKEGNP
jgi:hypothetical protein